MPCITPALIRTWLPQRPAQAHKGNFGRVLVVAGSRRMCGAGFLCAKSALTAGAGVVYWALPASMQPAFAASLPEVITVPLPETDTGEIAAAAWELFPEICQHYHPSLIVVGPGMGASPLLPALLTNINLPLIVDADGLNALARQPRWQLGWPQERPSIFTPHPGEIARLLRGEVAQTDEARRAQAEQVAAFTGGVCLCKGAPTWVAAQAEVYQNTTGGPALAKAGSGDVLTGVIAGLWAQLGTAAAFSVRTALQAAVCGVYLHGLAGDLAAQNSSIYSVLATDTLAHLPRAFQACREGL